ncbi:HU family DNA-binding protein [Carnobacterium mobile]|uniref:HU family DNA-binding protein n=1 Tax=Carnobacterium mobile TaxID=2750 RepID=UPI0005546B63|nr:HU family DNA-binding protein [Carnobacterium mobile]
MNRHDFVRLIAANEDVTIDDATEMVNSVLKGIEDALKKEQSLRFIGFGKFDIVQRSARKGRNPKTGEEILIPAKRRIIFKPGKQLEENVLGYSKPNKKSKK